MMVIIPHAENGENVEWHNEDDLNSSGLPLPEKLCWCQQSSCLHNGRYFFVTIVGRISKSVLLKKIIILNITQFFQH
jgi:hypothetical protein